jgi:TolB-like protein
MSFIEELKRRNVLRVAIGYLAAVWLLIQIVETLFPIFGFTNAHVRVVVILLSIGFPLVLVFSWVYELTPEGFKLERDVDRSGAKARYAGKKFDRSIIVVLTLAIGYFAIDKFVLDPARDAELQEIAAQRAREEARTESLRHNLIAVLPFENMSGDDDDEYYTDGVSEELLTQLAHVPRLQVISRRSSFSFKGKDITIPEIAERLNAAYVIDGTVRRNGDQLRITAQLIDAGSDTHLWSGSFNPTIDDIFATYDEISAAIVDALRAPLELGVSAVPRAMASVNAAAHEAYLRGRYLVSQATNDSHIDAVREFENAVELDTNFALGHAELAIALMKADTFLMREPHNLTRKQIYARVEHHVERAMAVDPGLAESQAAKGRLLWNLDPYDDMAVAYYRRAVEINPSYADGWIWLSRPLISVSRAQSYAAAETAARVDPLSRSVSRRYIHELIRHNLLDEAEQQTEKYALVDPLGAIVMHGIRTSINGQWSSRILAILEAWSRGWDDVLRQGLTANFPNQLAMIGLEEEGLLLAERSDLYLLMLSVFGEPGEAIALARTKLADDPRSVSPLFMGFILTHEGYYAEARPYLETDWQGSGERLNSDAEFDATFAEALFAARSDAGDLEGAQLIIVALQDNVRRYRDGQGYRTDWVHSVDYQEGIAAYLSGDRYTGIALIAKAADEGFWIAEPAPAFRKAMYEEPEFQLILERQKVRQAREREKVLSVVCNDNPYVNVWNPMEETCKEYASSVERATH